VSPMTSRVFGDRELRLAVLAVAAAALVLSSCSAERQPTVENTPTRRATAPSVQPERAEPTGEPQSITVEAIGVSAGTVGVGLDSNGAMEVPEVDLTGWYELGPRPGDPGPAVVVGHVDSQAGPAVFFRLGELTTGDRITVGYLDGVEVDFEVVVVEQHPKDELPVDQIWESTDEPVLWLITCGGAFDSSTGHYVDNIVVHARRI
jgi:hypothetical protein